MVLCQIENLKTSNISKFPHKIPYFSGMLSPSMSKFPHKRLYLVGCGRLGNLKTDRLLWFSLAAGLAGAEFWRLGHSDQIVT